MLDQKEVENILGTEQSTKDMFFKRREKKANYRSQGSVKKQSPVWDDED